MISSCSSLQPDYEGKFIGHRCADSTCNDLSKVPEKMAVRVQDDSVFIHRESATQNETTAYKIVKSDAMGLVASSHFTEMLMSNELIISTRIHIKTDAGTTWLHIFTQIEGLPDDGSDDAEQTSNFNAWFKYKRLNSN